MGGKSVISGISQYPWSVKINIMNREKILRKKLVFVLEKVEKALKNHKNQLKKNLLMGF